MKIGRKTITVAGFDWDDGNREKCRKHGVSSGEIEEVFTRTPAIEPDPSVVEERLRAIGTTAASRYVFLVFTLRERDGETFIRPISARYMHEKEVRFYEEKNPHIQKR